jgi:CRISPR system Cascade subunit CasC
MNENHGRFIQIHTLIAYPAALLNRDDTGLAKRLPFGGAVRTRISSQALKKRWRESEPMRAFHTDGGERFAGLAVRSRRSFLKYIQEPLLKHHEASEEQAKALATYLMAVVWGDTAVDDKHDGWTKQVLVMSPRELDYMLQVAVRLLERMKDEGTGIPDAKAAAKKGGDELLEAGEKENLRAAPMTFDMAMFGRMSTGDRLAQVDGAVGVAHAFTTHAEESEFDYFTAADMLAAGGAGDAGASHINESELTSGVFYNYVVINIEELEHNLNSNREMAPDLIEAFIKAIATASPGAKLGSTAPYAWADLVLLERGNQQPRSLANAFNAPIRPNGMSMMEASARALLAHREKLERMYGAGGVTSMLSTTLSDLSGAEHALPLADALDSILGRVHA